MIIYKIKSITITLINLERETVISKEVMENHCNEKDIFGQDPKTFSVNDDLETLFQDVRAIT